MRAVGTWAADSRAAFIDALTGLAASESNGVLCDRFLRMVDVCGTTIATLETPASGAAFCSRSRSGARAGELRIEAFDGPGEEATATRKPVIEPDLHYSTVEQRWGLHGERLVLLGVRSLFVFPLYVGEIDVGCASLYSFRPTTLTPSAVNACTLLAAAASRRVLRNSRYRSQDAE